jgi:UDP-N-acetylmuramoylalanine-D-glutamate ligase
MWHKLTRYPLLFIDQASFAPSTTGHMKLIRCANQTEGKSEKKFLKTSQKAQRKRENSLSRTSFKRIRKPHHKHNCSKHCINQERKETHIEFIFWNAIKTGHAPTDCKRALFLIYCAGIASTIPQEKTSPRIKSYDGPHDRIQRVRQNGFHRYTEHLRSTYVSTLFHYGQ